MPQNKFLNILTKTFYVLLFSFFTSILWNLIWTSGKKYHTGWDGIADVLGALMLGFIVGLILSIISLKYINPKQLKIALLVLLLANASLLLYLKLRPKPQNRIIKPESAVITVPQEFDPLLLKQETWKR